MNAIFVLILITLQTFQKSLDVLSRNDGKKIAEDYDGVFGS